MSLICQPMPEISGVSKNTWTAGHPVGCENSPPQSEAESRNIGQTFLAHFVDHFPYTLTQSLIEKVKKPLLDIVNGAALELSAEAVSFGAKLTSAMTTNDHSAEQIREANQQYTHNEAKSVAGNHWLRLSPSVALLRGQVWSSLGTRCQQQQRVD